MRKVDHTKNIIELAGVSFSYPGREEALENVTLEIHSGDYLGLIGPNGAGKTTLIKIILGLLKPRHGTVRLFGKNIRDFRDWHKIGYVSQKATGFDPGFPATVREVVLMGRYRKGGLFKTTTGEDRKFSREALKQVDMWPDRNRLIGELSGGQQQRVFIARVLANRPEVIFLDESTTGVDQQTQDNFYALLRRLNKELGLTLVIASHDVERIIHEVMHIACIDKTLTCHLSPEEYLSASRTEKILGQDVKIITHHHHKK